MTLQHQAHLAIDRRGQSLRSGLGFETDDKLSSSFITQLEDEVRSQKKALPDPIEILKKVMQQRGLSNQDLKPYIGSSGNVCDILTKRRPLSLTMIRKLHAGLGIPAQILIQEYHQHRS